MLDLAKILQGVFLGKMQLSRSITIRFSQNSTRPIVYSDILYIVQDRIHIICAGEEHFLILHQFYSKNRIFV